MNSLITFHQVMTESTYSVAIAGLGAGNIVISKIGTVSTPKLACLPFPFPVSKALAKCNRKVLGGFLQSMRLTVIKDRKGIWRDRKWLTKKHIGT